MLDDTSVASASASTDASLLWRLLNGPPMRCADACLVSRGISGARRLMGKQAGSCRLFVDRLYNFAWNTFDAEEPEWLHQKRWDIPTKMTRASGRIMIININAG